MTRSWRHRPPRHRAPAVIARNEAIHLLPQETLDCRGLRPRNDAVVASLSPKPSEQPWAGLNLAVTVHPKHEVSAFPHPRPTSIAMALPQPNQTTRQTQPARPRSARKAACAPLWLGLWALLGALPGLALAQIAGSPGPGATVSRPAALPAALPTVTPTAFAAGTPSHNIPPAGPTPVTPLPAASATPDHEALFTQARRWVMGQEQLPADQVRFAALDSRVRIAPCQEPLQFDYPFSGSRETVRVRCAGPTAWQLFLRLTVRPPVAGAPSGQPAGAPAAVAMRASAPVTLQPPMRTVVIAKRLLQRGTELDASMLEEVQKPAMGLDQLAISSIKDVARAETVRDLPAGTVLRSYDIKRSLMVRKGQSATLTVGQNGSFQITVRVEAQQDGHLGEQIRLKNPESGRLISGVVTGPNTLKGL